MSGEPRASKSGSLLSAAFRSWLTLENKKPTERLLGACSGQHSVGYRFSLLTLLFSGVCNEIKHLNTHPFRLIL
jgi:hypothetical protein